MNTRVSSSFQHVSCFTGRTAAPPGGLSDVREGFVWHVKLNRRKKTSVTFEVIKPGQMESVIQ